MGPQVAAEKQALERLKPLFNKMIQRREDETDIQENASDIIPIFSKNVAAIRNILGFDQRMEAFSRIEFAKLLDISLPTLKHWELGKGLPNHYSLRRLCSLVNDRIKPISPVLPAHLYCTNLSRSLTELRVGISIGQVENLNEEQQQMLIEVFSSSLSNTIERCHQESRLEVQGYEKSMIAILETGPFYAVILGRETLQVLYATPGTINLTEHKVLPGASYMDIAHHIAYDEKEASRIIAEMNLYLETGSPATGLLHLRENRHGAEYVRVFRHNIPEGNILAMFWDESEQQTTVNSLRKKMERTDAILDAADVAIIALDTGGRILRFNPACERITGYKADEVLGQHIWSTLLTPDEKESVLAVFDNIMNMAFPGTHHNYWVRKNGEKVMMDFNYTAITGPDGEPDIIVSTAVVPKVSQPSPLHS